MDYDIDKNELSNTSGHKGRHLMNASGKGAGGGAGTRD